ncbi:hypothetical protein KAW18_10335 [candidate division WOR-3 bacterium]|nr:hypothetical protein [candidate division WOR-3 bacterium]
MKEQIYSMIGMYPAPQLMSGMYIRYRCIYSQSRMLSDAVGYRETCNSALSIYRIPSYYS